MSHRSDHLESSRRAALGVGAGAAFYTGATSWGGFFSDENAASSLGRIAGPDLDILISRKKTKLMSHVSIVLV